MTTGTTTRRRFLKGVSLGAGAHLLSPIVDQLAAQAAGASPAPKRFVFVVTGMGLKREFVLPLELRPRQLPPAPRRGGANDFGVEIPGNQSDRLINEPLVDKNLPYVLEPLDSVKDQLGIVLGLSGRICGRFHSAEYGALGAYPGLKGVLGETIDLALARVLAQQRPSLLTHLALGMLRDAAETSMYGCSARGPDLPVPIQCRPDLVHKEIFGRVADGTFRQTLNTRSNLLDFLVEDIRRLEAQLAGEERQKLGVHLHALESLRQQQDQLGKFESTLRKINVEVTDKFTSAVETDRLDAQFDLAAAALITGLTSVVTIASAIARSFTLTWHGLGMTMDTHKIEHAQASTLSGSSGKTGQELSAIVRRYHVELIARLAKKLQAVPEGNGTMLDNTAIVFLCESAESHHFKGLEWPMIVVGNLGGQLQTSGRFLDFPAYGRAGHHTIANFHLTLLQAIGESRDSFGAFDSNLPLASQKGPLAELLA